MESALLQRVMEMGGMTSIAIPSLMKPTGLSLLKLDLSIQIMLVTIPLIVVQSLE